MKESVLILLLRWSLLLEIIKQMFLYGASGHAKVIIDILRAGHESIEALFDDNVEVTSLLGHPVLRPSEVRGPLIVSIGNNRIRKRIVDRKSTRLNSSHIQKSRMPSSA